MDVKDQLTQFKGELTLVIRDALTGKIKTEDHFTNMFVTAGKVSLAAGFAGTTDNNQGIPTYCAVGTSVVAPALTDVKLTTEIFRKLISARSSSSNVATFTTFYTIAEANGTLREAGLFGDIASGTADSGTLFCKAAINRSKSASDTLTLTWAVTIG